MSFVNVSEASQIAGISRTHFYRKYLNTKAIRVHRGRGGEPLIDESDLDLLFVKSKKGAVISADLFTGRDEELALAKAEIEHLKVRIKDKDAHIDDMRAFLKARTYSPDVVLKIRSYLSLFLSRMSRKISPD